MKTMKKLLDRLEKNGHGDQKDGREIKNMYRIIKDISSNCGSDDCYAIKSGWYIVDDLHDGRVKISEYNAAKNTWSDNIIIDEDILVIDGEVGSAARFTEEYELRAFKECQNKLYKHLEDVYGDSIRSFDALQAIDLFIEQYDCEIFADVLKKYNVDSEYVEACPPEGMLSNDIQIEYYKTLVDQWWQ